MAEWILGPFGWMDAKASLTWSPRTLRFALEKRDLTRDRAALWRSQLSTSSVDGESDPERVARQLPRGIAVLRISDYKVHGSDVDAVAFKVKIVVPSEFRLEDGEADPCPAEFNGTEAIR